MSWIKSQFVDSAGNVVTFNKIAKGNNLQLNVGKGEKAFDASGLVAAAVGAGGDFLINLGNEYQNTGDLYKDTLLKGIYGDASQGNLMQIVDNISGRSKNNALQAINDNTYRNTGVLGSNQDLINSFNSINSPIEIEKRGAGSIASTIGGSIAKGAAYGFAAGSAIPGIGNVAGTIGGAILGLAGGIGSSINGNKYEKIKKAQELAYNNSLNNFSTQVSNTTRQNNLNSLVNMTALGGQLDYNIDNKYLANDYMSKLNNRVYKPQFDSMNYFAMGGMPDFNEFNTGGTHEQNPNGGIPQGMDKQGIMNTVEQGETKITTPEGDYIFSDRLKLSKEECKQLGVPKDSTYAEASKILRKEYDEMPNDEIARRGWEQFRDMLIQSQEMQKQEIALKEARKQGLNSPKMYGINPQVMQDMYYNENPQEEDLLQQGMNPSIKSYDKGGSMYDIFQIGAQIPSLISGMKNPDYSYANEVLNSIGKDQRLSIPNNYTYHIYNPVDELQYLNRQQAQDAAVINTLQNTSDPSRNSSILAATAQQATNRNKLISDIANINHARKVENTKLNNAITDQINNNLYKQAQFNASLDNLDYNRMVQGLKMKQEADAIRGANLSAGLTGLSNWADARRQEDNSLGIAALSAVSQGVPFTDAMINSLYGINSKLGDIGFSTREDYSAYKDRAQRQAIIDALYNNTYDKGVYGNLDKYLKDQAIKEFIISQYNKSNTWNGANLGLSPQQLELIIKSINTGN